MYCCVLIFMYFYGDISIYYYCFIYHTQIYIQSKEENNIIYVYADIQTEEEQNIHVDILIYFVSYWFVCIYWFYFNSEP